MRRRAAERVERVVDRELSRHVVGVVLDDLAEAGRDGIQAGRLGRELSLVGIRAAHDEREGADEFERSYYNRQTAPAELAVLT